MGYGPGDVFAGYTIVRLLGRGGMGSVFLAKHPRLPRYDALKLLSDAYSADETYRIRFEREADLAAQLSHRNIVAVYDRGVQDGRLWIAMQYVAGTDAAQALQHGPMHAARAAHIAGEIGTGLHYAHLQGLVHRDVKPANILLQESADSADPENVLLADFGIAKLDTSSSTLTGEGNFLGTLPYTAPEVLNGAAPAASVDIYALGCVLFELLTGRVPFPVTSPLAAMHAHLNTPPPKPSELAFGVPPALDRVVQRAMAKDPADRFATCRDLAVAVRAAVYVDRPAEQAPPADETADAADRPRPPYTLTVRRFAVDGGVELLGPVDTATGSPAERGALETMLRAAGFFHLPLRLPLVRRIDNDPYLELTVAGGGRERTVGFERTGSRHPIELGLIIERLEQLAPWRRVDDGPPRPAGGTPPTTGIVPDAGSAPVPVAPASWPQSLPISHPQPLPASGPTSRPQPLPASRPQPLPTSGPRPDPTSRPGPTSRPQPAVPATHPRSAPTPQPWPGAERPAAAWSAPSVSTPGWTAPRPPRQGAAGPRPAEIAALGVGVLAAFALFLVGPLAGLLAVVLVVAVAVVVLVVRYRR